MKHETCKDCQALWYCFFVPAGCLLKYKNEKQEGGYIPLEECPKPLTDKGYKALLQSPIVKKVKVKKEE